MQNLQGVEFNKFILQNLAKYMPGDLVNNVPQRRASNISTLSHLIWNVRKPELVSKLWPMTVLIGVCEVVIGLCLLVYICLFIHDYDILYDTEDSKLISYLSVFGCAYLMLTGLMLLFALMLENQESIRIHIFMAVFMCVYMFVLACIKIHLSLLVIERDAEKLIDQATKHNVLLSLGCVIGVATLLGSVVYFIATVTVFTYYNLKYVQPN
ncbi:unnamed protein product [Arctia plantaginis]|uniref:Uncharacterized protein n=1 Tax=Arctia plantaginis TaxID=874455 RepID=A0A8S0YM26_ARCPL|nr:unnamed protein product [Arctia plantaginis]